MGDSGERGVWVTVEKGEGMTYVQLHTHTHTHILS